MKEITNGVTLEATLNFQYERSKKLLLSIVVFLCVIIAIMSLALFRLMPLKSKEIHTVTIDGASGRIIESQKLADINDVEDIKSINALNKFFVQQYIKARDSYHLHTLTNNGAIVQVMSSNEEWNRWLDKYTKNDAAFEKAMAGKQIDIEIVTLREEPTLGLGTPFLDTMEGTVMTARIIKKVSQGNKIIKEHRGDVRITFGYDVNASMDETSRNMNPLGFTVTSYEFTPEQKQ